MKSFIVWKYPHYVVQRLIFYGDNVSLEWGLHMIHYSNRSKVDIKPRKWCWIKIKWKHY